MIKGAFKLALVALVANAIWQFGSAYLSFYRFQDAVLLEVGNASGKSDEELRQRITELASNYDVPIPAEEFAIRRDDNHTVVKAVYSKPLMLLPSVRYPWVFMVNVDGYAGRAKINDLANPSNAK